MTMRVTITNDDLGRVAEVRVQDFDKDKVGATTKDTQRIGPGRSANFYIHAGRRLLVDEVPEP